MIVVLAYALAHKCAFTCALQEVRALGAAAGSKHERMVTKEHFLLRLIQE